MDRQPSLWETLEHCNAEVASELTGDILDIPHVSSYVWRAAKIFHRHKEHQEAFARDRLQRILEGDVRRVITGLRRIATQHKLRALYQSSYWDKFHESQVLGTSSTSTARL
jgi:hypothetical protein